MKHIVNNTNNVVQMAEYTKELNNSVNEGETLAQETTVAMNNIDEQVNAINDAISLGLHCVLFEIDYYICWGTPNDLKTFEYWQSCFDGWNGHSYKILNDNNN